MMWLYLSPHLDDIAISCGGLLWEQAQADIQTSIWTICAGDPPPGKLSSFAQELHARWGTGREAVQQRRLEDSASCAALQTTCHYFSIPDCIYRAGPNGQALYAAEESLFGPLHPVETLLINALVEEFTRRIPANAQVICPIGMGGHVDHRLVRAAAEAWSHKVKGTPLRYYADYPYAFGAAEQVRALESGGWQAIVHPVSQRGLTAWATAIAAHASQISTFWKDPGVLLGVVQGYHKEMHGIRLWEAPGNPDFDPFDRSGRLRQGVRLSSG